MKTVKEIFEDQQQLLSEPAVQVLIAEYETVCDDYIDLEQVTGMNKEEPLKELVRQILQSVNDEIKRDEDALRFKETARVDFKSAVVNLKSYIYMYLKDYNIRLY
ncbi:hypothetical protein LX97_01417 [Nonlabens dokdonensis]|jgi:predicted negative regulator of RcsB-dependent stress response|uniref:Uncharacterized protein n=2 Tax=Nonlabens dokdonensis TaxID=328515 RepID=L7W544_NONDD|nr:hypothetical protein [Nonlabens dokdonensis]AGC76760.1 hypothetical protein DDD_1633 [Nonlabens dokdonensis DSW-6]PZX44406.1 hypothetical protein LX97_01417 [Nonlabens dokdonensis]